MHTDTHTGIELGQAFSYMPNHKSSRHNETGFEAQFHALSPTETKQPFSQYMYKHLSVGSCEVVGGYF